MSGVTKKKGKQKTLKSLRGALKGLLNNQTRVADPRPAQNEPSTVPDHISPGQDRNKQPKETQQCAKHYNRENIVYIMSKEAQLIPKLTEEEVMERHKRADENMKRAWNQLIQKYESIEDQGDLLDLKSGEILEDNGHIRGLGAGGAPNARLDNYVSVLSDLIDVDKASTDIWQEEPDEDDYDEEDYTDAKNGTSTNFQDDAQPFTNVN
ncbi:LADA_0F13696g1_1 [Lachancea dasiensis]|uniref:LADA_0F13696g1_1 n=1 Tax=Lachancea dasiensis TaxID=1072105 RepID=A0A1G4JN50_9SACH|nr:LADA_0F13696g1_1 [Lachancea dasiensis]